ncbi:hypothetical protein JXA84_04535 [candidate division WOR-3 bacterium]|nr:hypothetical protein [candidate division WOR-3 bacterium]
MNAFKTLSYFVFILVLSYVINLTVTFLYNLISHGVTVFEWEKSIPFSIVLSIVLTVLRILQNRKNPQ